MWWAPSWLMWSICLCLFQRSEVFGESILDSSQRIHKALPPGEVSSRKWQHLSMFLTFSHLLYFLSLRALAIPSMSLFPGNWHLTYSSQCGTEDWVLCCPTCPDVHPLPHMLHPALPPYFLPYGTCPTQIPRLLSHYPPHAHLSNCTTPSI